MKPGKLKWQLAIVLNVTILSFFSSILSAQLAAAPLVIPGPRSALDISHDYHKTLLAMALAANGGDESPLLIEQPFVSESRIIAEIKKHKLIDVYWFGADTDLDSNLQAIPIPTTKGLIGFRKFIILQKNIPQFNAISNLKSLTKLTACQGSYWPDTKILKDAKFKVTTAGSYEDLFKMLAAQRCDYFPRGIHDHTKEVELRAAQYPDFVSYQDILLHYPFAVFFYVSVDAKALAKQLTSGMQTLAAKGEIAALMKSHPLTRHIFPLGQNDGTRYFAIPNAYIDATSVLEDANLWLQPEDFGVNIDDMTDKIATPD